jgi:hypothetical protein
LVIFHPQHLDITVVFVRLAAFSLAVFLFLSANLLRARRMCASLALRARASASVVSETVVELSENLSLRVWALPVAEMKPPWDIPPSCVPFWGSGGAVPLVDMHMVVAVVGNR